MVVHPDTRKSALTHGCLGSEPLLNIPRENVAVVNKEWKLSPGPISGLLKALDDPSVCKLPGITHLHLEATPPADTKQTKKSVSGGGVNRKVVHNDSTYCVTKPNTDLENRRAFVNDTQSEPGTYYSASPIENCTEDVQARSIYMDSNTQIQPPAGGDISHASRKHILDRVQEALNKVPRTLNEPYIVKCHFHGIEVEINIKSDSIQNGAVKRKAMFEDESPPASPGLAGQSILRTKVPKTTLANEVKEYFINLLVQCNVPLGGTGKKQLPWTTLTKTLTDHNLEIINWPSDVPMPGSKDDTSDDNKGIKGMRLDMLVKLHAAIKHNTCPIQIREASPPRTKEVYNTERIGYGGGGGFQGFGNNNPMQYVDYSHQQHCYENVFEHVYENTGFSMNTIKTLDAGYYDPRGNYNNYKRRRTTQVQ